MSENTCWVCGWEGDSTYGKNICQACWMIGYAGSDQTLKVSDTLRNLTSAERKAAPVWAGVLQYFPDALMAVARVSQKGNDKHNPGEPLHWAREKSADQEDCIIRHMLQPNTVDPDTGETHAAHAAWRTLATLQLIEEARLKAAGIRPLTEMPK